MNIGLCALIRLRQGFPLMKVGVYEQGDDIGGTWAKNTYPGLSCDIPSHVRVTPSLCFGRR
ncbi:NAD(P)-binding protein [Candidatus Bathyarchaeota archaeon]|nr:NAD(P)-binding protein [Candidatus Bathyarchaeota archaeon]